MLASASPRKPMVLMRKRSASSCSLLVAWDAKASGNSFTGIPKPSSIIRIRLRPPSSTSTEILVVACIDGIFNELLDDGCGAFNDFAGGDAVDQSGG